MKKLVLAALGAAALTPAAVLAAEPAPQPTTDMEAVCSQTVIPPNGNARFIVELDRNNITYSVGAERVTNRQTISEVPGGLLLSSTGPSFVAGSQGRNGQSPNIFGTFQSVKTYSGGSKVQLVTYSTTTTFTFGCTVYKITPGNTVIPPDLQVRGLTREVTVSRTVEESFSNPDVVQTELSEAVICNSPTRNPGVWRAQNGYTGTCSTALFNSLSQITIHSNSLPPLAPVGPDDFNDPINDYADGPVTLVDTLIDEDFGEEAF